MDTAASTHMQALRRSGQSLALFCWLILLATGLLAQAQPGASLPPWLPMHPVANAGGFQMPDLPLCLFRAITHWPCPFCGLTRGFVLIWQGHWLNALHHHMLSLPLFVTALTVGVSGLVAPERLMLRLRQWTTRRGAAVAIVILALLWIYKLLGNPAYW